MGTNRKCPICGHMEQNLLLDETDGWYECSECGAEIKEDEMEGGIIQVSVRKQGMPQKVGCTCPKCGTKQLLTTEEVSERVCDCYKCGNHFEIAITYGVALPVRKVG
jgi:uncharacterized Zn finger protein